MDITTSIEENIKRNAGSIQSLIAIDGILNSHFPLKISFKRLEQNSTKSFYVTFTLNENTYCSSGYMRETDETLRCFIPSVYSEIGNRSGTFLLQLQVLLAISMDCKEITLDNFTDDPARAAGLGGVYEMFSVDKRGNDPSSFSRQSLEDKLLLSEGQMRYIITTNSMSEWKKKMKSIIEQINVFRNPWDSKSKINLNKFITNIGQQRFSGGGGKKNTKQERLKNYYP